MGVGVETTESAPTVLAGWKDRVEPGRVQEMVDLRRPRFRPQGYLGSLPGAVAVHGEEKLDDRRMNGLERMDRARPRTPLAEKSCELASVRPDIDNAVDLVGKEDVKQSVVEAVWQRCPPQDDALPCEDGTRRRDQAPSVIHRPSSSWQTLNKLSNP
jgi:hypothetical protein